MNATDIERKLDTLMASPKMVSSDVGAVVTTSGILAIAIAMYTMLPSWSEIHEKERTLGKFSPYWCTKVIAALIAVCCAVVLVRMLLHSRENQVAAASVAENNPMLRSILDGCQAQTEVDDGQVTEAHECNG